MDKSSQVKNPSLEDYIQQNYIKATEIKNIFLKITYPTKLYTKKARE